MTRELLDLDARAAESAPGAHTDGPPSPRAAFVANVVRPGVTAYAAQRHRIEEVLARCGSDIVLQPVIELGTGRIHEVEALPCFARPPVRGPERWFAEAADVGLGVELEFQAISRALALIEQLPRALYFAVNASPAMFCSPHLASLRRARDGESFRSSGRGAHRVRRRG